MVNLKEIMDYQKFEKNARLQRIIDESDQRVAKMQRLSDDELMYVAAGKKDWADFKKNDEQ